MSLWTGNLSIGNRILDSEHKKLYGMLSEMAHSIEAKNVAGLPEVFERLESCLGAYFAAEERIARAVDFDFAQHRLAHQQLLDEMRRMRNEVAAGNCICPDGESYACCLMNCLIRHIREDSRPLRIVLDTCLYGFNP